VQVLFVVDTDSFVVDTDSLVVDTQVLFVVDTDNQGRKTAGNTHTHTYTHTHTHTHSHTHTHTYTHTHTNTHTHTPHTHFMFDMPGRHGSFFFFTVQIAIQPKGTVTRVVQMDGVRTGKVEKAPRLGGKKAGTLQYVAVCCSMLQCVVARCSRLKWIAMD